VSNLAKVVQHSRKERDQAQSGLDQLDQALRALTGVRGVSGSDGRSRSLGPSVSKAQDQVGRRTETDRGGATCALAEVESCSANEVSGMGPSFPHSDSQIFRFHPGFRIDSVRETVYFDRRRRLKGLAK
jgi:hypothetical protein